MKHLYNKFYNLWWNNFTLRNIMMSIFIASIFTNNNYINPLITFCISYTLTDLVVTLICNLNQNWLHKFDIKSCSKLKRALNVDNSYQIVDVVNGITHQKMKHYANPVQFLKDVL